MTGCGVADVLAQVERQLLVDVVGDLHLGESQLSGQVTPVGQLAFAALGVRAANGHVLALDGHLVDLGEEVLHRLTDVGVVHALVRAEHDRRGDAGALPAEMLVEDVVAPPALHVRQLELRVRLAADRAHDAAEHHQGNDPADDCPPPPPEAPAAKSREHGFPPGGFRLRHVVEGPDGRAVQTSFGRADHGPTRLSPRSPALVKTV
jgi:hypothetical protein